MSALDLLHHLIDQIYQEGFEAGFAAAALGEAHRQGESDLDWEKVARHAEANPQSLSSWEVELVDSILCSLFYGVPLTPKQKTKMRWIHHNRFAGKVS